MIEEAHFSLSTGVQALPALADVIEGNALFARVEAGAGTAQVQGYAVTQLALYDVEHWYYQSYYGGPYTLVGDSLLLHAGLGARAPFAVWRLRLVPHLDVGVVHVSTPFEPVAFEEDVMSDLPERPSVDPTALGAWAQLGGDVAYPVLPDAVDVFLAVDAGYITIRGVGPTLGARLGLAARF